MFSAVKANLEDESLDPSLRKSKKVIQRQSSRELKNFITNVNYEAGSSRRETSNSRWQVQSYVFEASNLEYVG